METESSAPPSSASSDPAAGATDPTAAALEPAPPRRLGRQTRWLAVAVGVIASVALLWPSPEFETAPDGPLETSTGEKVRLEASMTPISLVHFWSTWCLPCRTETPALQRLAADYAGTPGFSVVMVAVSDDPKLVAEMLGSAEATLYDPYSRTAHKFDTRQLPETHLVSGGLIVDQFLGATDWDDPAIRQRLDAVIASATTADGTS